MMEENMDKSMYMHMKKKMFLALIFGVFLGWLITWGTVKSKTIIVQENPTQTNTTTMSLNEKQLGLYLEMRRLWSEHVWWTREYLKSAINNSKDTNLVATRLLQNQEDIGNTVKTVYGDAAGVQLTSLLKTHIQGAVDVVTAAKSGNQKALATANTAWYSNADQIASFLATANPNWKLEDLKTMMATHLNLTKQEAVDLIGKKDEAAIVDFQKVENEILMMADTLSRGIIQQFPSNFQ